MIDKNRIEESCKKTLKSSKYDNWIYSSAYKDGFMACAKWLPKELLKDLCHSNTEKPQIGKFILAYTMYGYETLVYNGEGEADCGTNWMDIVSDLAIGSWCYPDDLFPGKGKQ